MLSVLCGSCLRRSWGRQVKGDFQCHPGSSGVEVACGWQEVSSALSHRPHPHLSYSDPCVLLIIFSFLSYLVLESPSPNTLCAAGRLCFLEALQLRSRAGKGWACLVPGTLPAWSLCSTCFISSSESIPRATFEHAECKVRHQRRASKPSHFLKHIQPLPPPPPSTPYTCSF